MNNNLLAEQDGYIDPDIYLPPDQLLDTEHPANDRYLHNLRATEREIMALTRQMTPSHVQIIKAAHKGHPNAEIAQEVNLSPATVSKVRHSDLGKTLLALLRHVSSAIAGPTEALRKNALWRIALKNEDHAPSISVSAIKELNNMDMALSGGNVYTQGEQKTVVVINQQFLPKGELD